jgi:hypothetical protein
LSSDTGLSLHEPFQKHALNKIQDGQPFNVEPMNNVLWMDNTVVNIPACWVGETGLRPERNPTDRARNEAN